MDSEKMTWVGSTVGNPDNVDLSGTYGGATAGASSGAGAGGNYLLDGFNEKISLQPLSAEGKSGFGFELGGQTVEISKVK